MVEKNNVIPARIIYMKTPELFPVIPAKSKMIRNVIDPRIPLRIKELPKYFGAPLLCFAISRITINPTPKSGKNENIAIKEVT